MSNLLISESPLILLPTLAEKIGINEAIVLQQIHYWINPAYNKNYINDRYWVYNTYAGWREKFKFWSLDTIKRTFSSLEHRKLILSGYFNVQAMDRTKWYTIDYEQLLRLESGTLEQNTLLDEGEKSSSIRAKSDNACGQNAILYNKEQRLLTKSTTKNTKSLVESGGLGIDKLCVNKNQKKFLITKSGSKDKLKAIVFDIFFYWQKTLNRLEARLDKKREKYILGALNMGYSIDDLCLAVQGVKQTPYNMGKNERGEVYDDFHIIFRDAAQIERFMRNSKEKPTAELNGAGRSFASQDAIARKKAFIAAKSDIEELKKEVLSEKILIESKEDSININKKVTVNIS